MSHAGTAAMFLAIAAVATLAGTEVVRSALHRRRNRRGLAGPQDVALVGAAVSITLSILAGIALTGWAAERDAGRRDRVEPLMPATRGVR